MEQRPYFILGDAFVNSVTGALVALVCTALFGPAWNMWLSMVVGMAVGMAIALLLSLGVFAVLFGAMEVMVPSMLTGMVAGMVVGMAAPADLSVAAGRGALVGLVCLAVTYAANAALTRASDS